MKKTILSISPYMLLLAPVFLLSAITLFHYTIRLQLPDVQTEVIGIFNRRTVFEVLCEVAKSQF